jgi:hypothetical protein
MVVLRRLAPEQPELRFVRTVVTARARQRPPLPDAAWTQRGPRLRSRPVADASGVPVLRDQGPIGRPGTARPYKFGDPSTARQADNRLC